MEFSIEIHQSDQEEWTVFFDGPYSRAAASLWRRPRARSQARQWACIYDNWSKPEFYPTFTAALGRAVEYYNICMQVDIHDEFAQIEQAPPPVVIRDGLNPMRFFRKGEQ